MKLTRFCSQSEYDKYMSSETLTNTTDHYHSDKGNKPPYVSMAYVPDTEKCDLFVKLNRRE